jgi:hypothetical protein
MKSIDALKTILATIAGNFSRTPSRGLVLHTLYLCRKPAGSRAHLAGLGRNPSALILLCSPVVLAGCQQHPLPPPLVMQPVKVNHAVVDAAAEARIKTAAQFPTPAVKAEPGVSKTGVPESPKPKDDSLVAGVQSEPDCLSGQLGDGLLLVFKAFTGQH